MGIVEVEDTIWVGICMGHGVELITFNVSSYVNSKQLFMSHFICNTSYLFWLVGFISIQKNVCVSVCEPVNFPDKLNVAIR